MKIAVVGTGISGLSAAWLLSKAHDVTVFESADYVGGHSNTVMIPSAKGNIPVDTGFIVYNEPTYPNLTALFDHLNVKTAATDMSFAVSLRGGELEYAGTDLFGLFAQKSNLLRPSYYKMLSEIGRFYKNAPADIPDLGLITLGAYLDLNGYDEAFRRDHLYPMAAAIWSIPAGMAADYPAAAFLRFCDTHGLLKITDRPIWRTVSGGSANYVKALVGGLTRAPRLNAGVTHITRDKGGVTLQTLSGGTEHFDHVVIAVHGSDVLPLLGDPTGQERDVLSAFRYSKNRAVLHQDSSLMPKRNAAWCSWNYLTRKGNDTNASVTYWMNRLQDLPGAAPTFVTLNPLTEPDSTKVLRTFHYEHPMFDTDAILAQKKLWCLQGKNNTWFCGAYFGAGFHEDGLQAGLAVAEQLGGVRRPWNVAHESSRIHTPGAALKQLGEVV